jgi:hypothetical protein
LIIAVSSTACRREEVLLTEKDVAIRIDSIVHVQAEFAKQRAAEDLDRRQAIEVKVKTDSILEARAKGNSTRPAAPTDREP